MGKHAKNQAALPDEAGNDSRQTWTNTDVSSSGRSEDASRSVAPSAPVATVAAQQIHNDSRAAVILPSAPVILQHRMFQQSSSSESQDRDMKAGKVLPAPQHAVGYAAIPPQAIPAPGASQLNPYAATWQSPEISAHAGHSRAFAPPQHRYHGHVSHKGATFLSFVKRTFVWLVYHVLNLALAIFSCAFVMTMLCLSIGLLPLCCIGVVVFTALLRLLPKFSRADVWLSNFVGDEEEGILILPRLDEMKHRGTFAKAMHMSAALLYFALLKLIFSATFTVTALAMLGQGFTLLANALFGSPLQFPVPSDDPSWDGEDRVQCEGLSCVGFFVGGLIVFSIGWSLLFGLGRVLVQVSVAFVGVRVPKFRLLDSPYQPLLVAEAQYVEEGDYGQPWNQHSATHGYTRWHNFEHNQSSYQPRDHAYGSVLVPGG